MKKSNKTLLKWIFGLLFFITGILIISEMILAGIISILLGLFLIPPLLSLFEKKIDFVLPSYLRWMVVIVGLFLFGYSLVLHQNKVIKNADLIVEEATGYIESGDLVLALERIEEAKTMYTSPSNKAVELENQINESQSLDLVERKLIEMSDDEFYKLQNGTLEFDIFQYETLNKNFVELLSENSAQRATLIADHERRLEEERIEAERRAEEQRIAEIEQRRQAEQEARQKRIESGFSAWDGSHRELVRRVKRDMNDPNSFEHVETKYGDRGDYLIVEMRFRGRNAFGGMVVNTVRARCSLDGSVQEIISYN